LNTPAEVTFRCARLPADEEAMTGIRNRCTAHDGIPMRWTARTASHELTSLPGHDIARDTLLALREGGVIGLAVTWRVVETDGVVSARSRCYVDPRARGRGIGRELLRRQELRQREAVSPKVIEDGRLRHSTVTTDRQPDAVALLEAAGYRRVRCAYRMEVPIGTGVPVMPVSSSVTVRPITSLRAARRVLDAVNEANRDHWGHHEMTDEDYAEILDHPDRDLTLWQVAFDGDEVASLVIPVIRAEENAALGRALGWIEVVATRRPWRRQGLATALLVRSTAVLRERGMTEVGLGVDTENPTGALRIYERLGFRPVMRWLFYEKDALAGGR
jgi:mycothiol synthase